MEFIQVVVSRGELPDWLGLSGSGYGYGYGYGYGDGSGYGDGYGYGSGCGCGDGYGYGSGDGDGYGYGSGSGSGYGDGSGSGDGSGYGSGDGDCYGYGYGDGSGSGYGYGKSRTDWLQAYKAQLDRWPEAVRARIESVGRDCSALAFWRSDEQGLPSNSGKRSIIAAAIGVVHEQSGPLKICSNALHATIDPDKWEGARVWVVALFGEVVWQDDKVAGLKREILAEMEL